MDPNATLRAILDAVNDRDRDALIGSLDDLATWLETGGFMPDPETINNWKLRPRLYRHRTTPETKN